MEEEWKIVMNEEKLDELSDKNEITICEHQALWLESTASQRKQAAAVEPKDPVQYEIAKVCRIVGVMAASVFWVHWARVRFLYNPINFFISAYDEFALWQNVSKGCGRRVENSNE